MTPLAEARAQALAPIAYQPTDLTTEHLGAVLARSGYFSDVREASQAIVKVLYGRELGIGPVTAMLGLHVIQGKPSPSAGLLAALIQRSGRYRYRVQRLDAEGCELAFFEREGDQWIPLGRSTFGRQDAEATGAYTGKNAQTWKAYGRNMLFARALSNGARWFCADVFGGAVYTPEELGAAVNEAGDVVPGPYGPTNRHTGEVLDARPVDGPVVEAPEQRPRSHPEELPQASAAAGSEAKARARFWAVARGEPPDGLGLDEQRVHALLGVETLTGYPGGWDSALAELRERVAEPRPDAAAEEDALIRDPQDRLVRGWERLTRQAAELGLDFETLRLPIQRTELIAAGRALNQRLEAARPAASKLGLLAGEVR